MDYAADRARRIEAGPQGGYPRLGGVSRQVRRQRERQYADASLSPAITSALGSLKDGEGLFTYHRPHWGICRVPGTIGQTRKSHWDHTWKYKHLFKEG